MPSTNYRESKSTDVVSKVQLPKSSGQRLVLLWMIATLVGGVITTAVLSVTNYKFVPNLILLGSIIGILQSLVLYFYIIDRNNRILATIYWFLISALSWILGEVFVLLSVIVVDFIQYFLSIMDALGFLASNTVQIYAWIGPVAIGVTILSMIQQRILRSWRNPSAAWTKVSILGWTAGWIAGLSIYFILPRNDDIRMFVGFIVGSAILGIITGCGMARILTFSPEQYP